MTKDDAVPVTAEDREAAAEYMCRFPDLRLPEAFARHRLASLSQTPATPMDELQRLGQGYDGAVQEGPFHVSRSSDGEKHWFSARDPAAGVIIPAKDREDAYALVASLNRSCAAFALRALSPTPAQEGEQ